MNIVPIYMSFISKLAGHFGQKSGLIGQWPADMDLGRRHLGLAHKWKITNEKKVKKPRYGEDRLLQ